jgi:NADPH2:quinone reductase
MTSQSARLRAHGEALVVEEVSHAAPGPDHAIVALAYSPINPFDAYVAKGLVAPGSPLPRTLGVAASGWIDDRPVVVMGGGMSIVTDGLWTEEASVPLSAVYEAPAGIDLKAAASVPVAGVTAWHALHVIAQVGPEDRVLVLGAAGGVGGLAVNIARLAGAAHVIGQTGDRSREALITEQGAHETVVGGPEVLAGTEPTIVIDGLGGAFTGAAVEALAPHGRIVVFGVSAGPAGAVDFRTLYSKAASIIGFGGQHISPAQRRDHTTAVLAAIASGELRVPVDAVLPLEGVNIGLARVLERGVRGRILLDLRAERETET